jgi:hypothetical protein
MRPDRSKDMSVHVSTCINYDFKSFNSGCAEVMALIRRVILHIVAKMSDRFF